MGGVQSHAPPTPHLDGALGGPSVLVQYTEVARLSPSHQEVHPLPLPTQGVLSERLHLEHHRQQLVMPAIASNQTCSNILILY